jgi:hypothetical protein
MCGNCLIMQPDIEPSTTADCFVVYSNLFIADAGVSLTAVYMYFALHSLSAANRTVAATMPSYSSPCI